MITLHALYSDRRLALVSGLVLSALAWLRVDGWAAVPLAISTTALSMHVAPAGAYTLRNLRSPSAWAALLASTALLTLAGAGWFVVVPWAWACCVVATFVCAVLFHAHALRQLSDPTLQDYTRYKLALDRMGLGLSASGVVIGALAPWPHWTLGLLAVACTAALNLHVLVRARIYRRKLEPLAPLPAQPSVSVVLIAYNEEKYLGGILEDLANQTRRPMEVLVVDDRSEDGTRDLALSYASRLPIRVVDRTGPRGPSASRNAGGDVARGDLILFLDADVRVEHTFLEQATAHLQDKGLAVTSFDFVPPPGSGRSLRLALWGYRQVLLQVADLEPHLVGWAILARREVHQSIRFDLNVVQAEDFDYGLRAWRRFRVGTLAHPRTVFSTRRLERDGAIKMFAIYFWFGMRRLVAGEIHRRRIRYDFGTF